MPWQDHSVVGERLRLIAVLLRGQKSLSYWCRVFGVSRKTAYKWKRRFLEDGRRAMENRSRRPRRMPRRLAGTWLRRIRLVHQKHPSWGAKKVEAWMEQQGWKPPCWRTIARWMKRMGMCRPVRRRPRKACVRLYPKLTMPLRPNQVWTVDFKGWFCTGDGTRVEPLTVRDLHSRYVLMINLLPDQRWTRVKAAFTRLFVQYGLPEVIRSDNGGPFASTGPAGLSRLSAWWVRLGIRVEFTRPAHPQDNGSHEQFHRVMNRETAQPPAWTVRGQKNRTTVWLHGYNHLRPHEALGQRTPAELYRPSPRKYPESLPTLNHPVSYQVRQIRSNGQIRWQGRKRFIGEAFVRQSVGLKQLRRGIHAVYFAGLLIGHLHDQDMGGMRPALYWHRRHKIGKIKV